MAALEDTGTSGGERSDAVDHCVAGIARLSNEVNDASSYIPAYDQRTYSEAIKALSSKLQQVRTSFAPRPKFAFKKGTVFAAKKNPSAISLNDAAELANEKRKQMPGYPYPTSGISASNDSSSFATTPAEPRSPAMEKALPSDADSGFSSSDPSSSLPSAKMITIQSHTLKHILLPLNQNTPSTSGLITNLTNCVIDTTPQTTTNPAPEFASLTLKTISNSLVLCAPTRGAIHLTNIQNSVLVITAGQFRLHDSQNCTIYLRTSGSKPVIENSKGIAFAPLPTRYAGETQAEPEIQVGGEQAPGDQPTWTQVQDFSHPGAAGGSPNWRVLPAGERVPAAVWEGVVPGGPGLGVEEVLGAVGLEVFGK